jgi:hypothetical protein
VRQMGLEPMSSSLRSEGAISKKLLYPFELLPRELRWF